MAEKNLFLLKRRIKTAKNIAQIAKAMEMISASKIKRAQTIVENNRLYSQRITSLTENIIDTVDLKKFSHPFLQKKEGNKRLLIAISPDRGLTGSLNTNLYKALMDENMNDGYVVVLGRKMEAFAAKMRYNIVGSFPMGTTIPHYSMVYQLIEFINQYYVQGDATQVDVLYARFNGIMNQSIVTTKLLPISHEPQLEEQTDAKEELPFLVEPNAEEILSDLLPYYIEVKLYDFLMNAYTSEQSARMVAMQNAKNNANDVADFLTLTYNKNRQEKITSEILDLANNQTV